MLSDQMTSVLALLGPERAGDAGTGLSRMAAAAAATALGVDGIYAGVGSGPEGVVLAWGGEKTSVALEDATFTQGQGPGLDAVATGVPVLVADLAGAAARWPAFVPAAEELGVRAVFAFPLRIGAISVGVLMAHRGTPGPLAHAQLVDTVALVDAVTMLLLHQAPAAPGGSDPDPGSGNRPRPGWAGPPTHRAEVHQATGMVSVQLGVSLAEALVRLRAHAYAHETPIDQVAADVVGRRLRLEGGTP